MRAGEKEEVEGLIWGESNTREEEERSRLVTFVLGDELYGVDIHDVSEVVRLGDVTKIPRAPGLVAGVTNLRGEIMSVLDIHNLLGLKSGKVTGESRLIITEIDGEKVGILVDGIGEALDVNPSDIQPPVATANGILAEYIRGEVKTGRDILIVIAWKEILASEAVRSLTGQ